MRGGCIGCVGCVFIVEVVLIALVFVCVGCGRGVSCEGNYAGYGRCAGFTEDCADCVNYEVCVRCGGWKGCAGYQGCGSCVCGAL